MAKSKKRQWGFVTRRNRKTNKIEEIDLYAFEKLELATNNVVSCRNHAAKLARGLVS